jgi:hypothetical protein
VDVWVRGRTNGVVFDVELVDLRGERRWIGHSCGFAVRVWVVRWYVLVLLSCGAKERVRCWLYTLVFRRPAGAEMACATLPNADAWNLGTRGDDGSTS